MNIHIFIARSSLQIIIFVFVMKQHQQTIPECIYIILVFKYEKNVDQSYWFHYNFYIHEYKYEAI